VTPVDLVEPVWPYNARPRSELRCPTALSAAEAASEHTGIAIAIGRAEPGPASPTTGAIAEPAMNNSQTSNAANPSPNTVVTSTPTAPTP
jgi:hypothetical protein